MKQLEKEHQLLKAITLCHNVMNRIENQKQFYSNYSNEIEIINFAKNLKYRFMKRYYD